MSRSPKPTAGAAVDWGFAGTVGARLARPGPPATDYTLRQVIDDLTGSARAAEEPVRDVTGLSGDAPVAEASVVDRPEWIRAASDSMRALTGGGGLPVRPGPDPTGPDPTGPDRAGPGTTGPVTGRLTARVTGAQTGAILAFVSSGILGQFDPFGGGETGDGRLLLVYPNVIAVERQLRVMPRDFRLWVCLHEVTHRVQFTANPWLAHYMSRAVGVLTSGGGPDFADVAGRLTDLIRERRTGQPAGTGGLVGFLRALQSEPQRAALDQLMALGTLLEGHADYVMDAVGPAVVPTVEQIRRRFNDRRHRRQSPPQRLLRALLGVDAKLSQYTRGRAFVDQVVGRVGMKRFNAVWSGPENLPLSDEIENPQRWIDRVL